MIEVTTNTSGAIQDAIEEAAANRSGPVRLLPIVYRVDSTIILRQGTSLVGVYPGVFGSEEEGTILKAITKLPVMIKTDHEEKPLEGYEMRDFMVHGNKSNAHSVTTGLELFGRKIRIDNVDVVDVSGTGVHFLPSDARGMCWVNWMTRCSVIACGTGILCEATDSFFSDNYVTRCSENVERGRGNSWLGNHFDQADEQGAVALRVEADANGDGSGSRIIGNYFDENHVGLQFTAEGEKLVPWDWHGLIANNSFRSNNFDIDVQGARGLMISGSSHRTGRLPATALRFDNCQDGLIEGCRFGAGYTELFENRPRSIAVRNCLAPKNKNPNRHGLLELD